jgi:hypothetical protein
MDSEPTSAPGRLELALSDDLRYHKVSKARTYSMSCSSLLVDCNRRCSNCVLTLETPL